ncbi:MAG: hypothetical protein AABP62_17160 [Planctomycetota bacterium]
MQLAAPLLLFSILAGEPDTKTSPERHNAHFEREVQFDAVWMHYESLLGFIDKAREFAIHANKAESGVNSGDTDRLRLSDGTEGIIVDFAPDFGPAVLDIKKMPPHSTSVRYDYSRPKNLPISDITVAFSSWRSSITVSGSDQSQVQAATAMLQESLKRHTSVFGNFSFKFIIMAVLLLCCMISFIGITAPKDSISDRSRVVLLIVGLASLVAVFSGSIEKMLPSCSIYAGHGWLNDYNALFTFLGLLLAILSVPIWRLFRLPSVATPSASASSATLPSPIQPPLTVSSQNSAAPPQVGPVAKRTRKK